MVLTNWRDGSELPILPIGQNSLLIGHLVLYLTIGSVYHAPRRSYQPQVHISSVTMFIGWRVDRVETPMPPFRDMLRSAVIGALDHLDSNSILRKPVIISPYLDPGDHLYCFPKTMRDIDPRENFAGVHFRSQCTCGYGGTSGRTRYFLLLPFSKALTSRNFCFPKVWKGIESKILVWLRRKRGTAS
jgi:hypothetical protein